MGKLYVFRIASTATSTEVGQTKRTIPFVPYLEGLRGIAALYVVLFHVRILLEPNYVPFGPTADALPFRGQFLLYGHYAVGIFIVISGFVLTLPIAVRGMLVGGWRAFLKRRARRLLPGYYAALTLALPLYVFRTHVEGKTLSLATVAGQYIAHLLLIHDLNVHTIWGINAPLWSVALEVQIYVLFVAMLVPVVYRFGLLAAVTSAFVLGYIPTIVGAALHITPYPFSSACFWFLGLFALGSAAAFIAYDRKDRFAALRNHVPWKVVSIVAFVAFVWLVLPLYEDPHDLSYRVDPILGIGVAAGFIAVAKDLSAGRRSIVATVLGWRPFVILGSFSYSLYLIHDPIILLAMHYLNHMPAPARLVLATCLVVSIILLAYAFARIFEYPFISSARRAADKPSIAVPHASNATTTSIITEGLR